MINKIQSSILVIFIFFSNFSFAYDPLTNLYFGSTQGIPVFVSKKDITEPFNLQRFLKEKGIWNEFWQWTAEGYWEASTKRIIEQANTRERDHLKEILLEEFPDLLATSKNILMSFLADDNEVQGIIDGNFIKKIGINRLLTHKKLQKTINDQQISRISLPKKYLLIKDLKTGKYLSKHSAQELINGMLDVDGEPFPLKIKANVKNEIYMNYSLDIYAEKKQNIGDRFGEETCNELLRLVKEAPFDVGFGNIFRDKNDHAIIIDTEFKGEGPEISANKLKARYCE